LAEPIFGINGVGGGTIVYLEIHSITKGIWSEVVKEKKALLVVVSGSTVHYSSCCLHLRARFTIQLPMSPPTRTIQFELMEQTRMIWRRSRHEDETRRSYWGVWKWLLEWDSGTGHLEDWLCLLGKHGMELLTEDIDAKPGNHSLSTLRLGLGVHNVVWWSIWYAKISIYT